MMRKLAALAAWLSPLCIAQAAENTLYTGGTTATRHLFVAYDASNVGKVYSVVDGAASAVAATPVGGVDLSGTAWSGLVASNVAWDRQLGADSAGTSVITHAQLLGTATPS
ncbi:hypothetical protein PO883_31955 [Massilia sp. DJPM01]|uniref:hypothetical protein n=1 Tax=Massilia sp. DJPM01 TaxID=3024404 RepID=UPI00259EC4BB|nr:hypothetical protein [Massilia sp. DJPM01]MDM5181796.1 hypothetical protein [Massilia sp. DJPM01]